ncbi:hypothetical protein GCM10009730_63700 [Streptomyces albidochromogenes]|uniref:hypothetical protein n=1 Tax=Streptomyces albidochromogenes TaxID=329524 RepID=UPI00110FE202|nr:hypothetical protein [Streptomyces albidochromogenes]
MRREALAAIDAMGAVFRLVEWVESTRIFRVQGEWTVTVSVSGTDPMAVREAFAAGLPGRRDEVLADVQKRIPRVSGSVRAAARLVVRFAPDERPGGLSGAGQRRWPQIMSWGGFRGWGVGHAQVGADDVHDGLAVLGDRLAEPF